MVFKSDKIPMQKPSPVDQIHTYMVFRAEREGAPHTLTRHFYLRMFKRGVRNIFNIELDDEGNILSDTENPKALAEWRKIRTV